MDNNNYHWGNAALFKKNRDYIPDNILLLYYDAHMPPICCRVHVANRDRQFCGILHYLEMFCSCLDKREKDHN